MRDKVEQGDVNTIVMGREKGEWMEKQRGWEQVCRDDTRHRFDPWVRKIPWRRKWQPTPVFLPGKSHGQRSLAGCHPWSQKESDTTEHTHTHILPPQSHKNRSEMQSPFLR